MTEIISKAPFNTIERAYISSKVSNVRWKPEIGSTNYLVTGTYGEDENCVTLWFYPNFGYYPNPDSNLSLVQKNEKFPYSVQELKTSGDVTGIKFVDNNKFLFSSKGGDFALVEILEDHDLRKPKMFVMKNMINDYPEVIYKPSYQSFEVGSTFICALGKFGHLYFISSDLGTQFCTVDDFSNEASCLGILGANEVLVGNFRGQLSLWDLRQGMFDPSFTFPCNSEESVGIKCVSPFPRQRYLVVSGGIDGGIGTWDLRSKPTPLTMYKAHDRPITCLQFHEDWPSNMFTATMGGEVWHWPNFGKLLTGGMLDPQYIGLPNKFKETLSSQQYDNPQPYTLIGNKNIPTNALDVIKEQLVCATDNDALVFVKPLQIN